MRSVKTIALGILLGAAGPGLFAQAKPATTTTKTAPPAQPKPAPQVAAKASAPPAAPQAKPPAAATKPVAQAQPKPAPPATKPATQAAKAPAAKPKAKNPAPRKAPRPAASASAKPADADKEPKIARRDPFASMVGREQAGTRTDLPPGKAGLQVGTLRLDGIVRAPSGMIAVVSNPQSRTYFLREGDQLYDGRVEKIAMDGVSFHEVGKDAFGKPVERQVNKRIYASAGEQQ
jgi:outer membrane biosynthesis protein TonB